MVGDLPGFRCGAANLKPSRAATTFVQAEDAASRVARGAQPAHAAALLLGVASAEAPCSSRWRVTPMTTALE